MPRSRKLSSKADLAAAVVAQEMPAEAATVNISPAGWLARALIRLRENVVGDPIGSTQASTNGLTGNIHLYPGAESLSRPELSDVIAHELLHTRQVQQRSPMQRLLFLLRPGQRRQAEVDAYRFDAHRAAGRRDIVLPPQP